MRNWTDTKAAEETQRNSYLFIVVALLFLSAFFLFLEQITHFEFLLHLAAIPLEILLGGFLVERYLASKEKEKRTRQLMFIKSCLFRSEMRNVFIANFNALIKPSITMSEIRRASLAELKELRHTLHEIEYRSIEDMEPIILEYVNSYEVFYGFMEWAIAHDFENIFEDMIFILHFIHDVKLYKKHNPNSLFIYHARSRPELMDRVYRVLTNGIVKFLDYAIELKEKQPIVFEELLSDYEFSVQVQGTDNTSRYGASIPSQAKI
jgi:hypothetical protein